MHELLPFLEKRFEVVKFSDEPEYHPIHNIFALDRLNPFDYSLTFNEDRKNGIFYRFASLALPGVLVLADANFDRLYFELHWQFKDLSLEPILQQIIQNATAVAVLNDHALSNVRNLKLQDEKALFGIQLPCRPRKKEEEKLIERQLAAPEFCIGYGGRYLNEEKAHEVIECLVELNRAKIPVKLLWLSRRTELETIQDFIDLESKRQLVDIGSLVEILLVESFIEERKALCRTDVFLSLRKDFLHSPPTAFYHALTLGIPTVAIDLGPMMSIARSSALWVPAGMGEAQGIVEAVKSIFENPAAGMNLSEESRKYTNLVHHPELVASDLIAILEYNQKLNPNVLKQVRERQNELEAQLC